MSGVYYGVKCEHRFVRKNSFDITIFRHVAEYTFSISSENLSLNNSFNAEFKTIISNSKSEAFTIHKILRDKAYAILYIRSLNRNLKWVANWKLTFCPNIKIKIKHIYLNKIPKRNLLR